VAPMLGANSPSATGGYQIMVVKRALCERLTALKLWRPLLQEGLRGQPHDVIPYVAPEIPSSPNKLGQDARFRAALRGVLGSPPCSRRCRSTRSPPPATAGADITPTGPASAPCCSQSCRDCRVWRVPGPRASVGAGGRRSAAAGLLGGAEGPAHGSPTRVDPPDKCFMPAVDQRRSGRHPRCGGIGRVHHLRAAWAGVSPKRCSHSDVPLYISLVIIHTKYTGVLQNDSNV
jgi:hypothetical protein